LDLFEKHSIIKIDPEQSYVLHSIALIYLRTGDDKKAEEYCHKSMNILQQNSNFQNRDQILADIFELFADIYIKRGLQLLAMQNYKESLDKLENILPKQYLAIERVRNSLKKTMN
jgi:Tfp pilus assembly protein PilF